MATLAERSPSASFVRAYARGLLRESRTRTLEQRARREADAGHISWVTHARVDNAHGEALGELCELYAEALAGMGLARAEEAVASAERIARCAQLDGGAP